MSDKSSELESRSAHGGSFGLFCARQSGFAGHVTSCSMLPRSTTSVRCRRCAAQVCAPGASLSFGPASAASVGSRPFLRATGGSPRHAGCLSSRLRSRVTLGQPSAALGNIPGAGRSLVPPFAATRGSRRSLRATHSSPAGVAGFSTRFSAPPFRIPAASRFPLSLRGVKPSGKTPNNGAAENRSGAAARVTPAASASAFPPPCSRRATLRSPSAVSELESLGVSSRLVKPHLDESRSGQYHVQHERHQLHRRP